MKTALFIGRFQPFHLGHLSVIKKALAEVDFLIIGIGSAEDNFTPQNPFTAGERFEMIKNTLDKEKINPQKYCILPFRNINNYALWCQHVKLLAPPFQIVYTGSSLVKRLFENEKKYKIKDIKKEIDICAAKIRQGMLEKGDWEKFVPKEVAKKIKELDGTKRIEEITESIPFA